ncbi:MAG: ABC-F family ATP-binding cassette domain-containing protein [Peptococcaceae bacterium]|nr:ABC-F family ATP-binding cassette domain-containing protein [Peptococcaceae bacterium]
MAILQVNGLTKTFITNTIFENISFSINAGQKVGLVGPNGAGKSTLMKCIIGTEDADGGTITFAKGASFGYLAQQLHLDVKKTLRELILEAFEDVLALQNEIRQLELDISSESDPDKQAALLETYQKKQTAYEQMDGYAVESHVKGIVFGLGFVEEDLERKVESFSGGERTRLMLARQLARGPEILLLDEPTNHLDLPSIEWLEGFLKNFKGTVLVISHDEYFLDAIVDTVLDLENQSLTIYPMGFFKYKEEKRKQRALQHKHFLEQQKRTEKELEYIRRNRAGVNSKQARGREKKLMRQTFISDISENDSMRMQSYEVDESARFVLTVSHLDVAIGSKMLAQDLSFDVQSGEKVSIIGRNGVGKSTLLREILAEIDNEDSKTVKLGNRVKLAYFDQHQLGLDDEKTVLAQTLDSCDLKISEAKTLLARYLFREDDLERPVGLLSGGEKVRLSFMIMLFEEPNFLMVDEPTNHLDMESKEIIVHFLKEFKGSILAVSHDRELLNSVVTRTLEMADGQLTAYLGNYAYYKEKKDLLEAINASDSQPAAKKTQPEKKAKKTAVSKSKLRDEIAQLEEKIAALEEEIDALNAALNAPGADYQKLSTDLDLANETLEETMNTWQEKSELLEEVSGNG